MTKYYFAGASRIAVRKYIVPQSSTLTYLAGDHLGSTSLAVDASTGEVIETRYKPWGEVRYTTPSKTLPTRYTFTGQYSYVSDEATDLGAAGFGLMFYNARWYDHTTGRFAQADTIVPGGVQGLDRYAYVGNNPVVYTDPSGHAQERSGYQSQIHAKNNNILTAEAAAQAALKNFISCSRNSMCDAPGYDEFETLFQQFYKEASRIAKNLGRKDALEAMAKIVDKAATIFNGNLNYMMMALGIVFIGTPTYGGMTLLAAEEVDESSEYSIFMLEFGDKGFHDDLRDGDNQVYHVWAFIAQIVDPHGDYNGIHANAVLGKLANNKHEFIDKHGSRQDFILSIVGMSIGVRLTFGKISPFDLGDALRAALGKNADLSGRYLYWQYYVLPQAELK
ncbi:MAG: hypothetical protein HFACDABA_02470 [Anaerolineales bacterium]|nr:hypothetical protein [Anaerolineales bacterium]